MKQKLETKSYQLDSTKGKITGLEQALEDLVIIVFMRCLNAIDNLIKFVSVKSLER